MTAATLPAEYASVEPTLAAVRDGYREIVTIRTPDQFTRAGELLKAVKGALKQIEDQRVAITKPINESLRAVNAQAKTAAAPFETAEREIKARMVEYSNEQERIRREEQRKVEAAAAAERARLVRLQAEAEAKARAEQERLRREFEEAAAAGRAAEAAKLAARADRVEEKSAAKIEALQIQEAQVVAPVIQREPPKVAGVATREVWKFRVTDPALVPDQYKVIDESRIRKVVQALKADANIPGVEVYSERQLAAGAA
jgi:hypothetical protein